MSWHPALSMLWHPALRMSWHPTVSDNTSYQTNELIMRPRRGDNCALYQHEQKTKHKSRLFSGR